VRAGEESIVGVMIESNLVEGNQKIPSDLRELVYGKSITDACVDWETTVKMLDELNDAVGERQQKLLSKI
jgi:3-deoxy-7-phosphoheptulonate synthase